MRRNPVFGLVLLLYCVIVDGCTARLNQINTFAQAGITYVTASQSVIQAAGTAAISTDSALLIKSRPDLQTETAKRNQVIRSDNLLKQRLQVLQLISDHGKLLQSYFEALASLSDTKAPNSVGTAAQGIYDSLSKVSSTLKNAKIGSTSVSSFIPEVTAPIVAGFRAHALDQELKARSSAIANELALQEAAFAAVGSELKTDLQEQQNFAESNSIDQFASGSALPADWAAQRLTILTIPAGVAAADVAAKAASQLRAAFTAVAENRLDNAGFVSLMSDISNMLVLGQDIKSAVK